MRIHSRVLAAKLRAVVELASGFDEESRSRSGLSRYIAGERRAEFSYFYRAKDGEVRKGYVKASTIERYIGFLQDVKLLDDDFQPAIDMEDLVDDDQFYDLLADTAKVILNDNALGVQKISEVSAKILRDDKSTLPTINEILNQFDTSLAKWRIRWLISLYTLGSTSLLRFRQSPLLLPRKYAKGR